MRQAIGCAVFAAATLLSALVPSTAGAARAVRGMSPPAIVAVNVVGVDQPVPLGKRPVLMLRVRRARTCSFSAQHEPSSSLYPVRTVACSSGSARITMPPVRNRSTNAQYLTYSVKVRGPGGTAHRTFSIIADAAPPSPDTTPPTPTPAPTPPPVPQPPAGTAPTPSSSTDAELSSNWSGYSLAGGPFTAVSGSFNVPGVSAASTETDTAEWVGIDGASNDSLIQAGVLERYDPTTSAVEVAAWWEILPALATPIPMYVQPGDEMTVTIWQISGSTWEISVTDDTSGEQFTNEQTYTGPGTSAEWVVEAPTSGTTEKVETLGQYTPAVTFHNLSFTGSAGALTAISMRQAGVITSTPSPLDTNGFAVGYGGTAPPAP